MKLAEARKNAEREAIVANLEEIKSDERFVNGNLTTRTMMLAMKCDVSPQAVSAKLKMYGIKL